jgi:hypothetical protein
MDLEHGVLSAQAAQMEDDAAMTFAFLIRENPTDVSKNKK